MLVTETGRGLPNAESYASVAAADARCVAMGVTDWAPRTEPEKEVALRRATQFMLANYRQRWAGRRVYQAQALDFPRYDVCVDDFPVRSDVVPAEVVNACIDLAVRAADGTALLPDLDVGNNQIKRDKTGPLETEYFENNTDASSRFVAIDAVLEPFFGAAGGAGMMKVVRG
ncbi:MULTISPECIES: DnaT-like ssDNA-binding protein [unclassified Duganella]|uniref:DnaT-like ssDNA-binding protein n=1 Tax=unclassified Duganella TaxID=2636909 RepID=UPI00087F7ADC|nr:MULTISPECIES: DnaT-like ssDNA-binding protein [unclassified Duganella]SDF81542.1 hypothetical protein SAMN05216320_1011407 [Duganella sp. OV458]SDI47972.1 hypothetical protein SAMN05428973_1018 [Duganella sp. OV510]